MRILTYKRTHTGDPDKLGRFGVRDCMGRVRDLHFDAVIGIGGIGSEACSNGIAGKITWIGLNPKKRANPYAEGTLVEFEQFVLLEAKGPSLQVEAPHLARRMYEGKVRYLLNDYTEEEQLEAEAIVNWLREGKQVNEVVGGEDSHCRPSCRSVARERDSRKRC
ncbi:hypothetical protein D3879_20775 [Pseudomonas cavernicola]|uniref:Uncharacterized protein n=1 Tax=Pseudomonas cavernicola TaxID=2320866 RepID=A0A418XD53_9PSED|nr:hypothetical protein [Pseudomonas cavernicola]RJG10444.1 hypothetical protein D3879_20775 [Pseudomonas cavernicola]